jgi:aminocarboxymuconate-semialdehyde decarboxylase
MIGTDYPYPWGNAAVDAVLETPGLSDGEKAAILGGTAARLMGIKI